VRATTPTGPLGPAAAAAALLTVALLLAGCGDDDDSADGYGAELRERFVSDCSAQGETEPVCGCFYDAMAERVPIERFRELDRQIRDGADQIPDDIVDLAVACGADPTFAG
jgi:hypothetical protein